MLTRHRWFRGVVVCGVFVLIGGPVLWADPQVLKVEGNANIFGAGHSVAPSPGGGGGGVLPPGCTFPARPGQILKIIGTSGRSNSGGNAFAPAEGGTYASGSTNILSYGGISGVIHDRKSMFLVGVFLEDSEPVDPAPPRYDFTNADQFRELSPAIGQTFFIGDGLMGTGSGETQIFHIPARATHLYLGYADAVEFGNPVSLPGCYGDNASSVRVEFEILVAQGNSPRIPSKGELTNYFDAARKGDWPKVELLIKKGLPIDVCDKEGKPALHYAAMNGHIGMVESLLKGGADPDRQDAAGLTAWEYAIQKGHEGTAEKLKAAMKADPAKTPAPAVTASSKTDSDAADFEKAIGGPAIVLRSEHVVFFAPARYEKQAKIIVPYLVKAYDELARMVGRDTEQPILIYNFPKGHPKGWGGTGGCRIEYDESNLCLDDQAEWQKYKVPHVSGYIEEMAHNFVSATGVQFGWEMVGWSIGVEVCADVAPNPIFLKNVKETRREQEKTVQRYQSQGQTFPEDLAPNLVDRIHAHLLWKCRQKYGNAFWKDLFTKVKEREPEFREAQKQGKTDNERRNIRYQVTIECFEALPGLRFKKRLETYGISLTEDIKSLDPTRPGWNRKLQ